jgi:hypothetical protein
MLGMILNCLRRSRLRWTLGAAVLLLSACGGNDGSSGSNASDASGNRRPTLSGNAPASVAINETYTFTPAAADADGDTLVFSIVNRPSWAVFNEATGELTGTPAPGDVGNYPDISIKVSDGLATTAIAAFAITVTQIGTGTATISWIPPTENTDGTVLTDLAGYRIHYGKDASNLSEVVEIDNAGLTSYMIENLTAATWFFAVRSVTADGAESALSRIASKTIR